MAVNLPRTLHNVMSAVGMKRSGIGNLGRLFLRTSDNTMMSTPAGKHLLGRGSDATSRAETPSTLTGRVEAALFGAEGGEGEAAHVLRLPGRALTDDPKHERDRVYVRNTALATTRHQGSRYANPCRRSRKSVEI